MTLEIVRQEFKDLLHSHARLAETTLDPALRRAHLDRCAFYALTLDALTPKREQETTAAPLSPDGRYND